MAMACSQPALLAEFKSLEDELGNQTRFPCLAINQRMVKGKATRCANYTSVANTVELRELLSEVIPAITIGQTDITKEIETISYLVLCRGKHQSKAKAQQKLWLGMIKKPDEPETQEAPLVTTNAIGSSLAKPNVLLVFNEQVDPITKICNHPDDSHSGPADAFSGSHPGGLAHRIGEDFEDPGYDSDDDKVEIKIQDASPVSIHDSPPPIKSEHTDGDPFTTPKKHQPRVKSEYRNDDPLSTPQRPLLRSFVDSAISMGEKTAPKHSLHPPNAEIEPPSSPLDKVSEQRVQKQKPPITRPGLTPLQSSPHELDEALAEEVQSTEHEPSFKCFRQPSAEMIKRIKEPLGKKNKVAGYLYVFKISGPAYYKIGYANKRGKKSMGKSFEERMKELRKIWPDLVVVFQCRLPHAQRAEQIIHNHFDTKRLTESICHRTKTTEGSGCKHKNHREWFNVPLNEIFTVASAWCHWIRSDPYPLVGGERSLSQDWIAKLDAFDCPNDLGLEPGYHWLEWLYLHTPESRSLKGLGVKELIKIQRKLEKKRELERLRKEQENEHRDTKKPTRPPVVKSDKASIVETSEIAPKVFSPLKSNSTWNHVSNYEIEKDSKTKLLRKIFHKIEGLKW